MKEPLRFQRGSPNPFNQEAALRLSNKATEDPVMNCGIQTAVSTGDVLEICQNGGSTWFAEERHDFGSTKSNIENGMDGSVAAGGWLE